jgi:unsaturated rhamnogalacturonyl hydrolase
MRLLLIGITLVLLGGYACTSAAAALTERLWLPAIVQEHRPFAAMRLTSDAGPETQPALSPDQMQIVYLRTVSNTTDIYGLTLNGGQPANLSQSAAVIEDNPTFSPDGRTIVFAAQRDGDWGIYLMDRHGGNVRVAIDHAGSDEQNPVFLPTGDQLLFTSNRDAGNWDIYSATIGSAVWTRLTVSPTVERFPTVADDGLTIALRRVITESGGGINSEIFVMDLASGYEHRITSDLSFDGQPIITPDGSGVVFISDRQGNFTIFTANVAGHDVAAIEQPAGWQLQTPRFARDGQGLLFAGGVGGELDLYWRPYTSPLQHVAARGFAAIGSNCDWDVGVLAIGWAKAWQSTGQSLYLHQLQRWVDGCLAAGEPVDHVNDGLLGYAALVAYAATGDARYLTFADRVADYLHTAERTPEGALSHIAGTNTVWDDTLISVIPFYLALSELPGRAAALETAVEQVLIHAQLLQNPTTGLYHHAWDATNGRYLGAVYWCRGNSWPMVAAAELLAALPADHPQRAAVLTSFQRQAAALALHQLPSGLWPTVVTRPDFYAESSGSAMIAYGLLRGVRAGWLDAAQFGPVAQRARFGLWQQVVADGTVRGVSAQTGPMLHEIDYQNIPIMPRELYGQGALLMMGAVNAAAE